MQLQKIKMAQLFLTHYYGYYFCYYYLLFGSEITNNQIFKIFYSKAFGFIGHVFLYFGTKIVNVLY